MNRCRYNVCFFVNCDIVHRCPGRHSVVLVPVGEVCVLEVDLNLCGCQYLLYMIFEVTYLVGHLIVHVLAAKTRSQAQDTKGHRYHSNDASICEHSVKQRWKEYLQNGFAVSIGESCFCSSSNGWTVVLESSSSTRYNAHELFNLSLIQARGSHCGRDVLHHVLGSTLAVNGLVDRRCN